METSLVSTLKDEPFIFDGLLEIPDLVSHPTSEWRPLQQASSFFTLDFDLVGKKQEPLHELRTEFLEFDSHNEAITEYDLSLEWTSTSETGETVAKDELTPSDDLLDDIWSLQDVSNSTRQNRLVTWDTFPNSQNANPRPTYLSEAGPICFDAFLVTVASQKSLKRPKVNAHYQDFLQSLFELGIGRDSLFYRYDQVAAKFVPTTEDFALPGISYEVKQDVAQEALEMGKCVRNLEMFAVEPLLDPLATALGSAILTILYAVKAELQRSKSKAQSVLQIKKLFSRSNCLVQALQPLVRIITTTKGAKVVLIKLTYESERLVSSHPWLAELLWAILRQVSAPWLSQVDAEIGLRPDHNASKLETLLFPAPGETMDEVVHENPDLLTPIDGLIIESKRCLEILRAEEVEHPVLRLSASPSLHSSWEASWQAISRTQKQANDYEQALREAVLKYGEGAETEARHQVQHEVDSELRPGEQNQILIDLDEPKVLSRDLGGASSIMESPLYRLTIEALDECRESPQLLAESELSPPLSQSLSLSLSPLLSAQSRLLSFSTLHLLFKTHSLRHHLSLQQRFQLMCDGPFVSRLSRALFDPDQYSGEGRRTAEGATGLRLQARDTWPPASSELRLVLMGILSESYHTGGTDSRNPNTNDLPGNLSFAIRDLSSSELDKVTNPSNLEALDFLRLQYKPPPAFSCIITETSLNKYDKIFKFMLRLLRLQTVAQTLLREVAGRSSSRDPRNHRLRLEMHHFITSLAAYAITHAIGIPWSRFQATLQDIESAIDTGNYEGTIAKAGSLSRLERLHEQVLDQMLRALFLDRRQAQVRDVIEHVFGLILRFSVMRKRKGKEVQEGQEEEVKDVHVEFQRQVGRVVRYLRSQAGAFSAMSMGEGKVPLEHLLLKLDMYGYYT